MRVHRTGRSEIKLFGRQIFSRSNWTASETDEFDSRKNKNEEANEKWNKINTNSRNKLIWHDIAELEIDWFKLFCSFAHILGMIPDESCEEKWCTSLYVSNAVNFRNAKLQIIAISRVCNEIIVIGGEASSSKVYPRAAADRKAFLNWTNLVKEKFKQTKGSYVCLEIC